MSTLLILYAIWAKVVTVGLGYYIVKLCKRLKQFENRGPIGYMCSTDYAHELSWGEPGVGVGSSVEVFDSLKGVKKKVCVEECGITKVQLVRLEIVQKSDFGRKK